MLGRSDSYDAAILFDSCLNILTSMRVIETSVNLRRGYRQDSLLRKDCQLPRRWDLGSTKCPRAGPGVATRGGGSPLFGRIASSVHPGNSLCTRPEASGRPRIAAPFEPLKPSWHARQSP